MAGSVITRSNFAALMAPGLKVIFDENTADMESEIDDIFTTETSEKAYETELGFVGLGLPTINAELELPKVDAPKQGRPVIYVHDKYALSVAISYEAKDDDTYGKIAQSIVPELTTSFKVLRNQKGADLLNNAFTLQGYEPDGVPLISNAHPLVSSAQTVSNLVNAPLSIAGLQQARALLRKTLSESGKITPMIGTVLFVPPSLESLAEELVKSALKPGQTASANGANPSGVTQPNEVNLPWVRSLRVVVLNYLTDNNQWFLAADKGKRKMKWYERKKLYQRTVDDIESEAVKMIARARWSRGFSDWRGIVGYPGS